MFDIFPILLKTKLDKINDSFQTKEIQAGIVFDVSGCAVDKILFTKNGDSAKDVFSDKLYSLKNGNEYFVSDIVSLSGPIRYFFKKESLNLAEMYLVYKRFLSSDHFINSNLDYFGMCKREVGYKGKVEIIKNSTFQPNLNQETYYGLMNIINCKNAIKKFELENAKRK